MLVRDFRQVDAREVLALAPRLTVGTAVWRDPAAVASAVRTWVQGSIEAAVSGTARLLVAEDTNGAVAGFVTWSTQRHWSGEIDANIGELVVARSYESKGVGRSLVEAVIEEARAAGHARISLSTGLGNSRALTFYDSLGFQGEDITLTRDLETKPDSP